MGLRRRTTRLTSEYDSAGLRWAGRVEGLLQGDVDVVPRRRAMMFRARASGIAVRDTTYSFVIVACLLAAGLCAAKAAWIPMAACLILALPPAMLMRRGTAVDLVRVDRRGLTVCMAVGRRRHRVRTPGHLLWSCRVHDKWLTGWRQRIQMGPRDAVILRLRKGDQPFVPLYVGTRPQADEIAEAMHAFLMQVQAHRRKVVEAETMAYAPSIAA